MPSPRTFKDVNPIFQQRCLTANQIPSLHQLNQSQAEIDSQ